MFSSKGGTGKTFLTSNLGAAIATHTQQDTAVVDLDFDLGDVFSYFGREPGRPLRELVDMADEATRETVLSVGSPVADHLWTYGSPHDPSAEVLASQKVGSMLRLLRRTFAYTVVDASADYSDHALAAFDLSDTICLITGLDVVGVRHLSRALETLVSVGIPRDKFRFVLNRADSKVALAPEEVERVMKLKIDSMIPSSRLVPTSLNTGTPVMHSEPKSNVSRAVAEFAAKVVRDLDHVPASSDEQTKKFRLFGRS